MPERRIMSILNYFRRQTPQERGVFVLPTVSTTGVSGEEIAACNNEDEPKPSLHCSLMNTYITLEHSKIRLKLKSSKRVSKHERHERGSS